MNQPTRSEEKGLTFSGGRPKEEDVLTRRKLSLWDRSKWLVLLIAIWLILVWTLMGSDPLIGFLDAARLQVHLAWWVFVLIGLELIHQIHFFISERSAAYNQFWLKKVWGKWERFSNRKISAWTKFRITRVFSWIVIIVVVAIVTGHWYLKQIYRYAYFPLAGTIWLLGAIGQLPRVKPSTKGEGHERRYFYGSVWAVCWAQPALWLMWKVVPESRAGDTLKLVVFLAILAFVGNRARLGRLPRTRPIVPGELAVSD